MKKSIILFFCITAVSIVFSQTNKPIKINSEISSASIYLSGAELVTSKVISINKGETELIFENLSSKISTQSIRITTEDGVDLLNFSHQINYLSANKENSVLKNINDSIKIVLAKITSLTDESDAYQTEKKMLLENTSIGGTNNGVSVTELKLASDFYRTRIIEINKRISEINLKSAELNIYYSKLINQQAQISSAELLPRSQINIIIYSETAKSTKIEIKYIVTDCGWSPAYDIKAVDTDKPVDLIYRAKVFNNTGIDWIDLKFKLSTSDPTLSASKPVMNTWFLNFETQSYNKNDYFKKEGYIQNRVVQDEMNAPVSTYDDENSNISNGENLVNEYSQVEIPELSAEFDIERKYTIPSDDKPYIVEISKHQLPATYKHFAVTKLDKDVFLLARITGWEDLDLVQGPANIYYAGTYIGQSFIDTRNVKDTLDLSLGRDNKVLVTRSKLNNYSSTTLVGTKLKETKTFEYSVKNNRKTDIEIEIHDQLPVSQSDEIEVKYIEISGAEYELNTGQITWKFKLAAGESKKLTFSYYIKYPKNKSLETQKNIQKNVRYMF